MATIVVVMPTYNESSCISEMIETLMKVTFPRVQADMHLLIVDDTSPDGTGRIVSDKMGLHPRLHLLTGKKEGLGWAYVRGINHAVQELHADAVIEMDADFQKGEGFLQDGRGTGNSSAAWETGWPGSFLKRKTSTI